MPARTLMGYNRPPVKDGKWKKDPNGERPSVGAPVLHPSDLAYFRSEIAMLGAKTLLEFGPGDSTQFFADLGLHVTTVEHEEKWYEVAKERFKDCPNVRVLKGENEMPFRIPELGAEERFDLAFVDAPQGYAPKRKVHKGYEDCSRFNTALFALGRCPVVLLHDAIRPLERGTLNRLNRMDFQIDIVDTPFGMARIAWPQQEPT